jgi:hypothetical protein
MLYEYNKDGDSMNGNRFLKDKVDSQGPGKNYDGIYHFFAILI